MKDNGDEINIVNIVREFREAYKEKRNDSQYDEWHASDLGGTIMGDLLKKHNISLDKDPDKYEKVTERIKYLVDKIAEKEAKIGPKEARKAGRTMLGNIKHNIDKKN